MHSYTPPRKPSYVYAVAILLLCRQRPHCWAASVSLLPGFHHDTCLPLPASTCVVYIVVCVQAAASSRAGRCLSTARTLPCMAAPSARATPHAWLTPVLKIYAIVMLLLCRQRPHCRASGVCVQPGFPRVHAWLPLVALFVFYTRRQRPHCRQASVRVQPAPHCVWRLPQ